MNTAERIVKEIKQRKNNSENFDNDKYYTILKWERENRENNSKSFDNIEYVVRLAWLSVPKYRDYSLNWLFGINTKRPTFFPMVMARFWDPYFNGLVVVRVGDHLLFSDSWVSAWFRWWVNLSLLFLVMLCGAIGDSRFALVVIAFISGVRQCNQWSESTVDRSCRCTWLGWNSRLDWFSIRVGLSED